MNADDPPSDEPEAAATWTCIVCERTFRADQPRFYDPSMPAEYDICIDCSH